MDRKRKVCFPHMFGDNDISTRRPLTIPSVATLSLFSPHTIHDFDENSLSKSVWLVILSFCLSCTTVKQNWVGHQCETATLPSVWKPGCAVNDVPNVITFVCVLCDAFFHLPVRRCVAARVKNLSTVNETCRSVATAIQFSCTGHVAQPIAKSRGKQLPYSISSDWLIMIHHET